MDKRTRAKAEWLTANGIDTSLVPIDAVISIEHEQIVVPMRVRGEDGHGIQCGPHGVLTETHRFPMIVQPPNGLL